ncbi:hypothetical protein ABT112_20745 [Streptomyces sp. NPDC002055]|uniref:hypothetical protein n=1 Tax=Streptomyces sp. NPDC002055 TaxID=3154534 RepID=UPI0033173321
MKAAPAGPLDGAAHDRPKGWLACPLTTDRHLAEEQARVILAEHYPGAPSPAVCITARYRTAAFALGCPAEQLLKRHADESAYLGEVLAYQVLAGERVLPSLRSACDTSRTLIVDYLGSGVSLARPGVFDELIRTVVAVHTASARWHPSVGVVMSPWSLLAMLSAPTPQWLDHSEPWRLMLDLLTDAHGPDHVPLGHLDLKPDHVRRHADGHLALIDAETLRPDLSGLPDLITLAFIAHEERYRSPRWVRGAYLHHVNELGGEWTDRTLVKALTAFATATGLRSLHGVAA